MCPRPCDPDFSLADDHRALRAFSLSPCLKQAKGVIGVQGTLPAALLTLFNGSEKLTLRFDCKVCEIYVVEKLKPAVAKQASPLKFYKGWSVA